MTDWRAWRLAAHAAWRKACGWTVWIHPDGSTFFVRGSADMIAKVQPDPEKGWVKL